jgi:excinuclease ABC subunit A
VVRSADWIIDLGPEAGDAGGNVVFTGKPADIRKNKQSITAQFL